MAEFARGGSVSSPEGLRPLPLPQQEPRRSFYTYRCTTDKLTMHMERIEESGDHVQWPVFLGGRDWLLVCVKAGS